MSKGLIAYYIICTLLIISAVCCGIAGFKLATRTGYINGDGIDVEFTNKMENFSYSSSSVGFRYDAENSVYIFEKELLKVEDFNGLKNKYQITLNDYLLEDMTQSAGYIKGKHILTFFNINGEPICNGTLNINIEFFSSKSKLTISSNDNLSVMDLWQTYFNDYGINLKVNIK